MEFKKRATISENDVANYRHWESKCGNYRVSESKSKIPSSRVAVRFYAERRMCPQPVPSIWLMISEHRTRLAAENACDRYAKK